MTSILHGNFVWYELVSTDAPAARRFYGDVLGWDARDSQIPGIDYHVMGIGGTDIAGSMQLMDGMQPGWTGYIAVDDVKDAAEKALAAGATTIVPVNPIPGVGHFSILLDPQGACFALVQYAADFSRKPTSLPEKGLQGHGWWRELRTTGDAEQAFAFYHQQFGWPEVHRMPMPPDGFYLVFGDGMGIGGMFKDSSIEAPQWMYYFWVDDIDATQAKLEKAGGKVMNGPHEVPGGTWVINALDPQGVAFSLVGYRGK